MDPGLDLAALHSVLAAMLLAIVLFRHRTPCRTVYLAWYYAYGRLCFSLGMNDRTQNSHYNLNAKTTQKEVATS